MNTEGCKTLKSSIAVAIFATLFAAPTVAQDLDGENQWRYSIAPYLWGTNIDGKVGGRRGEVDVSADFSDLVEFTDIAGALRFEAVKKWGFFGDIWFASLSNDKNTPLGKAEADFDQMIAEAGGLYAYRPDLTTYLGIRYQSVDGDIRIPVIGESGLDESWMDAIIGVRYTPDFGRGWLGLLRADIGAGDSDLTWLAQLGVGYHFGNRWSGYLAYRYLDTDLDEGDFKWEMVQEGLGLGLVYQF